MIQRGSRKQARVDFAVAKWERNEFGVDVLLLNQDEVSGALTMALKTPVGLEYPEREHFYDCDQDLFQFEGEFHHDEENPFRAGDYVYRPPGTVYGHSQGSAGGIIIAALNNRPSRYHFDDHPAWQGEYLIDAAWQTREVQPLLVHSNSLDWQPAEVGDGIALRKLRGEPDSRSALYGARNHSPWGADAACILRYPAGYSGALQRWPDANLELLMLSGSARIGDEQWHRGCYGFDVFDRVAEVSDELIVYARFFLSPR